jgi:hypothetical protein
MGPPDRQPPFPVYEAFVGVVIPTYCNDTVVRIPPDMDPATNRQLMRQTGRRLADGYLNNPPLC